MKNDFGGVFGKQKKIDFGFNPYGSTKTQRKPINKNLRDNVWFKYIGGKKAEAKCYCCRVRPIHITDFQVGHNKAVSKGGYNHIDNLRPICGPCNRGMGTKSIEWYRKKYYAKPIIKPKKIQKKPKKRRSRKVSNENSYLTNLDKAFRM